MTREEKRPTAQRKRLYNLQFNGIFFVLFKQGHTHFHFAAGTENYSVSIGVERDWTSASLRAAMQVVHRAHCPCSIHLIPGSISLYYGLCLHGYSSDHIRLQDLSK